jgi:A/G-specific adenine glycosylase
MRPAPPRAADLLVWYERNARRLPWRAPAGERPDPYRVWLSEIMLQQTTVRTVGPYFLRFITRWPSVQALAAAPLEEVMRSWAGLGYYARARNLHACARLIVARHGGRVPRDQNELGKLPGIGPYTAAAIGAIAFDAPAAAVDGNAERVTSRLFAFAQHLPAARPRLRQLTQSLVPADRAGDFAQALMDLGALVCTAKRPACMLCPWVHSCAAHRHGDPEAFPIKAAKREGRLRAGAAFVVTRADRFLLVRTRPSHGLLGAMTEVPTTDWTPDFNDAGALLAAPRPGRRRLHWRRIPGRVRHLFTHFPLELVVYAASVGADARAPAGMRWLAFTDLADEALPGLMRKVIAHAVPIAKPGVAEVMGAGEQPRRAT